MQNYSLKLKNKDEIFISSNLEETRRMGEKVAKGLQDGNVLALYGDLGSGKTTFVQGLAKGLGVTKRMISPTFVIMRSYKLRVMNFYHLDLYRIKDEGDLKSLGIQEIVNDPKNIIAIEWAEKMGKLLPKKRLDIKFKYLTENKRQITITNYEK